MNDRRSFQRGKPDNKNQVNDESYAWLNKNKAIILEYETTPNLEELLKHIKSFVEHQCKNVSASQLRNIFSKLKAKSKARDIQLNRPKLAYAAARQTSNDARGVIDFFENIASEVKTESQAKNYVAFLEAVVAYHKYYHGKK